MDIFKLYGGSPLKGSVKISGSKNAALPLLAAAVLTDEPVLIHNVPKLSDVHFMVQILEYLGAEVAFLNNGNSIRIQVKKVTPFAPYDLVRKMRASICFLGPLLSRCGQAKISLPGGCVIGQRPVDLHIQGMKQLGYTVDVARGYIHARGDIKEGSRMAYMGGRFGPTVTGTANVIMAAVLMPGETKLIHTACEPELVDLCNMLVKMGASIDGIGSHTLTVRGVERLNGCEHTVIGDRIEAGTFLIAGLMNPESEVMIEGAPLEDLMALMHVFDPEAYEIGANDSLFVRGGPQHVRTREVVTFPFPGFPTDLQAQLTALYAVTPGMSMVTERIHPNRFMHVPEMQRLGAQISLEGASAVIQGVERLSGAPVMASDLRASATLVLAGLVAEGETLIQRVYHLDRGYESIDSKLAGLGAHVERLSDKEVPSAIGG